MPRSLALAGLIICCVVAPSASAATAPARVAFPIAPAGFSGSGGGGGPAGPTLGLPDGAMLVLVSGGSPGAARALKLRRDGSPDPTFGTGGVVALPPVGSGLQLGQAERLPDGRLLLAGTMRDVHTFSPEPIVLMQLLPDGTLDPSFGTGGVAVVTSMSATPGAAPMAVAGDGSIVLTGAREKPGETNPLLPATTDWVVARLHPDGSADASFGVVTVPVGSGRRAEGTSVALTPSGEIVVVGYADEAPGSFRQSFSLVGLTALGAIDPGFNGGAPALVGLADVRSLIRRADGSLELVGSQGVARFTAAGTRDADFATGGVVLFASGDVRRYVPTPDGGALLQRSTTFGGVADPDRRITVQRLTAAGTLGASTTLYTPFGGGIARPDNRKEVPVKQNAFDGTLVRRDDGSWLLIGGLSIYYPTGKMDGISAPFFAAQAFTSALVPDRSFGGPQQPARLTVEIRRQRARTAAAKDRLLLRVTASQAGLVFLRVRDARGRVIASGTHPVYAPGTTIMRVLLTTVGRRALSRAGRGLRITVRHDYRDIFATAATGVTKGRLG